MDDDVLEHFETVAAYLSSPKADFFERPRPFSGSETTAPARGRIGKATGWLQWITSILSSTARQAGSARDWVEVEDSQGKSIDVGEWVQRPDGYWALRIAGSARSLERTAILERELERIYDNEINVRISWLWDGGIDVWLGDELNDYLAQENVSSFEAVVPWLQEAIAHFYPASLYAKSLEPQIRERAERRVFRPRSTGAQVRCP